MKRMTVDRAVEWAYRDELPKSRLMAGGDIFGPGFASVSAGFVAAGSLGTLPDNLFGVVVDPYAVTDPAPEAVLIHEAVRRLGECDVVMPDGWQWDDGRDFGPCRDAIGARVAAALAALDGDSIADLVRRVAILGRLDCVVDDCEVVVETSFGKPKWYRRRQIAQPTADGGEVSIEIEVDGYNAKTKRPYDDAYRKYRVEPDPTDALIARAKMEIWRAAMDALVDDLAG